ncbi:CLOCK-interacting pacemaker [Aplochiton taeniatus]
MPKEQGNFREQVSSGTSKKAKDKSNSATLRASQNDLYRDKNGLSISGKMSTFESERDSGYSETGSDSLQTDLDDDCSSVVKPYRVRSKPNNLGHSMPVYGEQTPIYVIKNLMVNTSGQEHLVHSPLAWGVGWHSLPGPKTPTQLLLIEQPGMTTPVATPTPNLSLSLAQDQPKKGGSRAKNNQSSKNLYFPILNSYHRIAPRPTKEALEQVRAGKGTGEMKENRREGQSKSKRVCTEDKREVVSTTSQLLRTRQEGNQREGRPHALSEVYSPSHHQATSSAPQRHGCIPSFNLPGHYSHQNSAESIGSPSVSSTQTQPPLSYLDSAYFSSTSSSSKDRAHGPVPELSANTWSDHHSDGSSTRQRRFHNTAEILSQTGLMAITLRTKALLRQNDATERDIAELRQHAELLCMAVQAAQSSPELPQQNAYKGPHPLDKLFQSMVQSGSYPSMDWNQLKILHYPHADKGVLAEKDKECTIYKMKCQNSVLTPSPPSPLFAPSPESPLTSSLT